MLPFAAKLAMECIGNSVVQGDEDEVFIADVNAAVVPSDEDRMIAKQGWGLAPRVRLICIKHSRHILGRMAARTNGTNNSVGWERAMAVQFLLGTFISVINIMIHALVTVAAIDIARRAGLKHTTWPRSHLMAVMVTTAVILMVAHTVEVLVWALAYALVGAAPEGSELLYFTFVNYTTLGYGDITPVQGWRLTGPITAMNGILMFGWSTAVLFEVLRKTLEHLASISESGSILEIKAGELMSVE